MCQKVVEIIQVLDQTLGFLSILENPRERLAQFDLALLIPGSFTLLLPSLREDGDKVCRGGTHEGCRFDRWNCFILCSSWVASRNIFCIVPRVRRTELKTSGRARLGCTGVPPGRRGRYSDKIPVFSPYSKSLARSASNLTDRMVYVDIVDEYILHSIFI